MNHQNLLLQDDPFAAPDSLEHLPSHHCGQDAEKSLPVVADAKSQMMREINLDLEAHPLDRNPAVLARAVSHIEALERQLAEAGKDAELMDIVRSLCCLADSAKKPDNACYAELALCDDSPLMIAARKACIDRGFTAGGLSIDAAMKDQA